jgi:hypothetical protein
MSEVVKELSDNPITDETPIPSPHAPQENITPFIPQQPQGQPQSLGGGGYAPSNAFFAPQGLGRGLPPAPGAQSGFGASGFFQPGAAQGISNAVPPSGYMQSMPGLGRGLAPTPQSGAVNAGSHPSFFQPSATGYPNISGHGAGYETNQQPAPRSGYGYNGQNRF